MITPTKYRSFITVGIIFAVTKLCLVGCENNTATTTKKHTQVNTSTTHTAPPDDKVLTNITQSNSTSDRLNAPDTLIKECTSRYSAESSSRPQATKPYSLKINGEKFTSTQSPLLNGDKLRNLKINQEGFVSGNIIVLSKDLHWSLKGENYNLTEFKPHTYRLIPKSLKVDYYCLYQAINKLKNIDRTELSIDYRPKKKSSF